MAEPEILAPCGSMEALTAAVRCGADAVYFGMGDFNARRHAGVVDAQAAAEICRLHGVKSYVTLNTLVTDEELENFIETLKRTCRLSADALILQDLGALRLMRTLCPDMRLHASTQMSVGTPLGLALLKERGFRRAVLPRELSRAEIETVLQDAPLETELFVHGALCMCVSGQCLLSAMLGARSGNRGLCAQPCRLAFAASGGTGHDLSLKDLSLFPYIHELQARGVTSLKIEGRMKRPEFVAAAVTACREARDNAYSESRQRDLAALFSRSGFTDGYYQNRRGREMFGTRQKEDVVSATSALLKTYQKLYEKERAVRPVAFRFTAKIGEIPTLTAVCAGHTVTVKGLVPCAAAKTRPLSRDTVCAQLQKCGGTVFFAANIDCTIDANCSLPLSALNQMRRDALDALRSTLEQKKPIPVADIRLQYKPHTAGRPKRYLRFRDARMIPQNVRYDRMFLPLDTPKATLETLGAGVYLPRGLFGSQQAVFKKLRESGAPYALCDTLDAVAIAKCAGVEVIGGAFLNLTNTPALEEAAEIGVSEVTVSHELTLRQIGLLGGDLPRGVCVYGRTPLMLFRNCPIRNGMSCAACGRNQALTDRKGIRFPVRCENGFSELFNSRPVYLADRLSEVRNVDFYLFDFTTENAAECARILRAYDTGESPSGAYTRGLFYRGVE